MNFKFNGKAVNGGMGESQIWRKRRSQNSKQLDQKQNSFLSLRIASQPRCGKRSWRLVFHVPSSIQICLLPFQFVQLRQRKQLLLLPRIAPASLSNSAFVHGAINGFSHSSRSMPLEGGFKWKEREKKKGVGWRGGWTGYLRGRERGAIWREDWVQIRIESRCLEEYSATYFEL